jgi:glycosyltransferase involved in cell wall biosynthesis
VRDSGLRFAIITTFYPPYHFGGDANYVRQLAHVLARRGHHVDVIHDIDAWRMLSGGADPEPVEEPAGISRHGLQSRLAGLSCIATQQLGRPLVHGSTIRRILADGHHHVIHYHNISLVGGPGILGYGNAIKLYTAHEHWLVCPTHVLWRHNREVCDRRECLRCVLRYRRPPQMWRYSGYLQRMAAQVDQFCSPSEFSAAKHREFGFLPPMEVLPSFLPERPAEQAAAHRRPAADGKYFLFVGRLEKIKGLQDIIPAFSANPPAELRVVGSGDYEQTLRRLSAGCESIRFLGYKQQEELRDLYANALAVILPSICYEVFPLVALEALREGTPLIARDLGPYPEIIRKSGAGLLFGNDEELRQAVHRLSGDEKLRTEMGQAAVSAYHACWSEDAAMTAYFTLIRRLAGQRDNRASLEILDRCDATGRLGS